MQHKLPPIKSKDLNNKSNFHKYLIIAVSVSFFFCGTLLHLSTLWIKKEFGSHISAEAILYTLSLPVDGADFNIIKSYLKRVVTASILTAVYGFLLFKVNALKAPPASSGSGKWAEFIYIYRNSFLLFLFAIAAINFVSSLIYLNNKHKLFSHLIKTKEQTLLYENYYQRVSVNDVIFEKKNNVILIVLESIEETYNTPHLMGDVLMPELKELRYNNTSFYGFKHTEGASWTLGGMTAFLFGIPMHMPNESGEIANKYGNLLTDFLPSASSILTIFEKNGYDISFYLGSKQNFAGQGKLVTSHTLNGKIYDLDYFKKRKDSEQLEFEIEDWGAPDYILFEEVKKQLELRDSKKPFFWIIQTVDTHAPGKFNGKVPRKWNDFRDSLSEVSFITYDFTEWIKKSAFSQDTTIIILGDHLAMRNNVGPISLPPIESREVYNVFINPVLKLKNSSQHRQFAAFDIAPTIIESAGGRLAHGRFGLGTSLFRPDVKTLFELRGEAYYNNELAKNSSFYDAFYIKNPNKQ